mmetsp:Transcript_10619/g.30235  ORF Transcript_10619/g.30235 Transcript_10619/m.30235 type:complete len:228 (-) Transcript_10619:32-715(-)
MNPLGCTPALQLPSGHCFVDADDILRYLEDNFPDVREPTLVPDKPEQRRLVSELCRYHDRHISNPRNEQPGLAQPSGALCVMEAKVPWQPLQPTPENVFYMEPVVLNVAERASMIAEMWVHLSWLEQHMVGPYLAGPTVTLADMTWFPTCACLEYILPRVFGWPAVFHESLHFPRLTEWYELLEAEEPAFRESRAEVWGYWMMRDKVDLLSPVRRETQDKMYKWSYP